MCSEDPNELKNSDRVGQTLEPLLALRPVLLRFARRYTWSDPEDLVQIAYCAALRLIVRGGGTELRSGYLFRTIRNAAVNDYRRKAREVPLEAVQEGLL